MLFDVETEASRGLRWAAFGLAAITCFLAVSTDPAEARRKKRSTYNPPYASIVVDANSGKVLQQTNADSRRYPASLTKVMTLYLLFERLESGRLKLSSRLPVSAHAARQPPTKLGLKPGQTIEVEDAILALVTKSANDAAVVVAEAIGGSETGFARMMTRKARALGMRRTTYANASGLPDTDQVTTARDQALLGRAIQERFPRYYHYFATEAFEFRGRQYRTHNRLLTREGVDGIKTGYIRASGFNVLTAMRRGPRRLVAVVLGGRSARRRDAQMRELLADHIMTASTRRTESVIVAVSEDVPLPPSKPLALHEMASTDGATASIKEPPAISAYAAAPHPEPGSTDPIKPVLVKTVSIKPFKAPRHAGKAFAAVPLPPPSPGTIDHPAEVSSSKVAAVAHEMTKSGSPGAAKKTPTETDRPARSGWMVQVGAFDAEQEARVRLTAAQSRAKKLLGGADAFTEPVTKGDKTLYRARFAGLDKRKAEAVCRMLKRNEIACFTLRN